MFDSKRHWLLIGAILLGVGPVSLPDAVDASSATEDRQEAEALTDEGSKLINDGRLQEALRVLERAVEADDEYWEAHYQYGRTFGLLAIAATESSAGTDSEEAAQQFAMARDELVRAGQLNPGHAHTHYLAWLAAYNIEDYETAWDQAIRASLAGMDMNEKFLEMFHKSPPPDDFEVRINAAKIYVADLEAAEVGARAELPFNRNPLTGGDPTISGRPPSVMGRDRMNEYMADLIRIRRKIRETLSRSPYFGLVSRPERSEYVLLLSVDELGEIPPVFMNGYVRIFDLETAESVYFRPLRFRDIHAEAVFYGELERFVTNLELWLREHVQKQ